MFEKQQVKGAVYFKEYPCYQFPIFDPSHIQVQASMGCAFSLSYQKLRTKLPATIVDKHRKEEALYILQWLQDKESIFLYLKTLEDSQWTRIRMNYYPDLVTICGGLIFAIGGEDMFFFDPKGEKTIWRNLGKDQIISVHPLLCQKKYDDQRVVFEPGVSILFESQQNQFYYSNHSQSVKEIIKPHYYKKAINYMLKTQKILYLQVLVPNILALAFLEDERMCIYSLTQMKLLPQHCAQIKTKQRPIVRWKEHAKGAKFDEKILILVGVNQFIYSFSLEINYDSLSKEQNNAPSLATLLEGSMVVWESIKIKPYLLFATEGNILVDMEISSKGFVYLSKNTSTDLIGECRYIDFDRILNQATIMTQQSNIWRLYYEEKWSGLPISQDRLLMPNRYPYELVASLNNSMKESQHYDFQILNIWRKQYGFRNFVVFGEQLLIVRTGSLSLFRDIEKHLFDEEYLNSEHLHKIEPEYLNALRFESLGLPGRNNKNIFNLEVCKNRELLKERLYIGSGEDIDNLELISKKQRFNDAMAQLRRILAQRHEEHYHSLVIKDLQQELICQLVRDSISYLHLLLTDSDFLFNQEHEEEALFNELYEKQQFTVKVIQFFYDIYHRSSQQYRLLGYNLIDLFVKKHFSVLSDDTGYSVSRILQMLLTNLIPEGKGDLDQSTWYTSYYIEFLLDELKVAYDENSQEKVTFFRQQISRIVGLGFFNCQNRFKSYFLRNGSLLKGLFTSYNSKLLEYVFLRQTTVKYQMKEVYECYHKVRSLMESELLHDVEKYLFSISEMQRLKIDRINLLFQRQLPQGASLEIREKYRMINNDILETDIDFEATLESADLQLLSGKLQGPITLGIKQFDL